MLRVRVQLIGVTESGLPKDEFTIVKCSPFEWLLLPHLLPLSSTCCPQSALHGTTRCHLRGKLRLACCVTLSVEVTCLPTGVARVALYSTRTAGLNTTCLSKTRPKCRKNGSGCGWWLPPLEYRTSGKCPVPLSVIRTILHPLPLDRLWCNATYVQVRRNGIRLILSTDIFAHSLHELALALFDEKMCA